jgi:hypothetical protein
VLISSLYLYGKIIVMQVSKIAFSEEEMEALMNARFFEVKQQAIDKVFEIFAELEIALKKDGSLNEIHYKNLEKETGKIFRGENYRNLPYVVLDFPKLFSADNIFTFRSMFWWGNEFSFTLHLQGHALYKYRISLRDNIELLLHKEFYFCVNHSPWQYYFMPDNFIKLDELANKKEISNQLETKEFVKLSRRIAIKDYEKVVDFGNETFQLLLKALTSQ